MRFRVMIIGGTGQVGAAVVRALVALPSCTEIVTVNRKASPMATGDRLRQVVLDTGTAGFQAEVTKLAMRTISLGDPVYGASCVGVGKGSAKWGCKPKPQKIPSPQIQPSDDRIEVDNLPVAAKCVMAIQVDVAPSRRRHLGYSCPTPEKVKLAVRPQYIVDVLQFLKRVPQRETRRNHNLLWQEV